MSRRVVLVHGAWGSPQMWDAVRDGLSQGGVESDAADLPTMRGADGTFDADVAHVRDLIGSDPTIVCSHSYGGMVASAASAGVASVEHLVYLAAGLPAIGESMFDWIVKRPNPAAAPLEFRDDGTTIPTAWAQDNGGGYDAPLSLVGPRSLRVRSWRPPRSPPRRLSPGGRSRPRTWSPLATS